MHNQPPPKFYVLCLANKRNHDLFFNLVFKNILYFTFMKIYENIPITYCKATPSFQSVVRLVMLHSGITACNHANIQFLC